MGAAKGAQVGSGRDKRDKRLDLNRTSHAHNYKPSAWFPPRITFAPPAAFRQHLAPRTRPARPVLAEIPGPSVPAPKGRNNPAPKPFFPSHARCMLHRNVRRLNHG